MGANDGEIFSRLREIGEGVVRIDERTRRMDDDMREHHADHEARIRTLERDNDKRKGVMADFDAAMEEHLRTEREARGYTTREPDVYLNSQVPRWASDARDWIAHRDDVMLYALEIMNAVEAGTSEPPTMAEFTAGLPQIAWSYTEP